MLGLSKKKPVEVVDDLSTSLEDYIETILELQREGGVVRVRDIAEARDVRAASVSVALRRLDEMGLIEYAQREHVKLTDLGLRTARRVRARHEVLRRLFTEVLGLSPDEAESDACAMEHSLGERGMDHLARFLEFITVCPQGLAMIKSFRECDLGGGEGSACARGCDSLRTGVGTAGMVSLADIAPGDRGTVRFVAGRGPIRQRLLDMGILPGVEILVERVAPAGGPVWIALHGYQLSLRRKEAEAVLVTRAGGHR